MLRILLITLVTLVLFAVAFVLMVMRMEKTSEGEERMALPTGILHAGDRDIIVELATDSASQRRGLSYRAGLDNNRGMLFIFDKPIIQHFWMYEMNFPLDMIFINGDKVVQVVADVPSPEGGLPKTVTSSAKADKVLEINAGKAAEWGIKEGGTVSLK